MSMALLIQHRISVINEDYVTSGSQNYVDGNSKPIFTSTPELEGIGVKFNPDGTHFDPQDL